ncbi:MAG: hypothetical protein V3S98_08635 [Dehalococcoidia bacterium]
MKTQGDAAANGRNVLQLLRAIVKINLDVLFWFMLVGVFIFMYFEAREFNPPGDRLPQLVGIAGVALLATHAVDRALKNLSSRKESGRILDIGYDIYTAGLSKRTVWLRTAGFFLGMLTMMALIWAFGFHIGLPLPVFLYMRFVAKASWFVALWPAVFLWFAIVVVYGIFVNSFWHESQIELLFDFNLQEISEWPVSWLRR